MKTAMIESVVEPVDKWDPRKEATTAFTYVDLSSIDQTVKAVTSPGQIRPSDAPSRARQLIASGDVLVSTVRPNLNAVAYVPRDLDGATASTGICVLRPNQRKVDGRYLFHWVRTRSFVRQMVRRATGASYPAVSDRIVKEAEIPLPVIEEQRRIAAVLDAADALRDKRRRTVEKLDGLTQAIFVDMFGDPVSNPRAWPRVALGDALSRIDSGNSPVCHDRPATSSEWGVLKAGAVTYCAYDDRQQKSLPQDAQYSPSLEVRPGDLLFSRKNTYDLVGACAYVYATRSRLLLSDLIFRLVLSGDAEIAPVFLWQQLIHPRQRQQVQRLAGGSSGSMPNVSKARLKSVMVCRPPISLQEAFVDRALAVHTTRRALDAGDEGIEALSTSLRQRAFRGEL